jgi:hypothetical protein
MRRISWKEAQRFSPRSRIRRTASVKYSTNSVAFYEMASRPDPR